MQTLHPWLADLATSFSITSLLCGQRLNILRPRQDGRNFPDDIFIYMNEKFCNLIKI